MRFQASYDDDRKLPSRPRHVAQEKRDSDSAGRTSMVNSSLDLLQDPMDEGDDNATRQAVVSSYARLAAAAETSSSSLDRDGEDQCRTGKDAAFPLLIPSLPDDADTTMVSSTTSMEARSSSLRPRTIARPKTEEWLLNTSESRPVVDSKMIYESPATIQKKILDIAVSTAVGTPVIAVAETTGRRFFDFRTPTKHSLRPRPRKESCSPSNQFGFNRALLHHQEQQRRHQHHQHQQPPVPMLPFLASPKILPQPIQIAMDRYQQPQQHEGPMLPFLASPKIVPQPSHVSKHQPPPPLQQPTNHHHNSCHSSNDSQQCGSNGSRPTKPKQTLPQFPNF